MFFRLGMSMLSKQRVKVFMTILSISLGTALIFANNLMADMIEHGMSQRFKAIYGNIDHTVYRTDGQFTDNSSKIISMEYLDIIKRENGVLHAAARLGKYNTYFPSKDTDDIHGDFIMGINYTDQDEKYLGNSIILDCIPSYGDIEDVTLEDLLVPSVSALYPVVMSKSIAESYGYDTGDKLKIKPVNATKAYASVLESLSVANGTIDSETLEKDLQDSDQRWIEFTITGVLIDGSEALEKAIPHKSRSLNTISAKDKSLYVSIDNALKYIFNNCTGNYAGYFIIETNDDFDEKNLKNALNFGKESFNFSVFDLYSHIDDYTMYFMTIIRLFFSVIGAFTMLFACILIKNLMQISIMEQVKTIGILKINGFSDKSIGEMFLSQILFFSVTGTVSGIFIGYFLGQMVDLKWVYPFLSYNYQFNYEISVEPFISIMNLSLTIVIGFITPMIFGLYPLKVLNSWTPIEMMYPIHKELQQYDDFKKDKSGELRFKSQKFSIKKAIFPSLLMILSIFLIGFCVLNLFPEGTVGITAGKQYYYIGGLLFSVILFVIAFLFFFQDGLSIIGASFIKIGQNFKDFLKGLGKFARQSIYVHSRKNKGMMNFMVISLVLMVFFSTVVATVLFGAKKNDRTNLGGDVVIFQPMISSKEMPSILGNVSGIDSASICTYLTMESWSFNRFDSSSYIVNQINGWGGKKDGEIQSLSAVVINDIESYLRVNEKSYNVIVQPRMDFNSFMKQLERPDTIIIDTRLASDLKVGIGSIVNISINGFFDDVEIVGIAKQVPGVPFMTMLDSESTEFSDAIRHRAMVLGKNTLMSMLDRFVGDVDIMLKNKTIDTFNTDEEVPEDIYGYLSGRMDRTTMIDIINSVDGIEKYSQRFSTFVPGFPRIEALNVSDDRFLWKKNDSQVIDGNLNISSRFYVFDPIEEIGMTSESSILESNDWVSNTRLNGFDGNRVYNQTSTEIAYAIDNFIQKFPPNDQTRQQVLGNRSYCIVSKYSATYDEDYDLETIYVNHVGDVFNLTFEDGDDVYSMEFIIAGVVDNYLSFYHDNDTNREGFSLSSKTLNYNVNLTKEEIEKKDFFEIFDVDANIFLTSYGELEYMQYKLTNLPAGFKTDSLMNHIYIDVKDGENVTRIVESLENAFENEGIVNISVFNYKERMIEKLSNFGSLSIRLVDGYNETAFINDIREWFIENGYSWKESSVGSPSRFISETQLAEPIFNAFLMNFLTSMLLCSIGVAVNVYMLARTRHREFGILKSVGFHDAAIKRVSSIESMMISFVSSIVGIVLGVLLSTVIFEYLNMGLIKPAHLEIPWSWITLLTIGLFIVQVISSEIVGKHVSRLSVAENIRNVE